MLIRLLVACGVLLTASHASAQHACGPGCSGADGGHTAGRFQQPHAQQPYAQQPYVAPPTQAYGYERQVDPRVYGYRSPNPQDTRGYRGTQNRYSANDRRQQFDYRMMQNPNAGVYGQQPRLPSETQQGERGHQHGGACNHGHGHSDDGYARSRGGRESGQYREAPGAGGVVPQYQQPYPSDLQPMEQPSLPPAFPMQSRIERNRIPYSPPSRSRSDSMRNAPSNRSDYLNI